MLKSRAHCPNVRCPDENKLMALTEGTLSAPEVQELENILDRCSHCSELMVMLARELYPGDSGERPTLTDLPPTIIGRYQVRRLLGSGGMGVIYEAYDEENDRTVALKLIRPDVLDPTRQEAHTARMLREARLLAALNHRNIPNIYEVGTWNDKIFLAMQFVPGANMRQWLERENPDWTDIINLYLQAGEGIVAAHQSNIVHRDVKPDNILVAGAGEVYVTDFGLARFDQQTVSHSISMADAVSGAHDNLSLTGTGDILGTPAYMAPEQYQRRGVSKRSDQFSFCVSLYEALYGMRPFAGQTMDELIASAQRGAVFEPRFSIIPDEVLRVLTKGMHPIPRERYGSMRELLDTLYAASTRSSKTTPSLRIGAIAAATLFVIGVIWLLFYNWGGFTNSNQASFSQVKTKVDPALKNNPPNPKRFDRKSEFGKGKQASNRFFRKSFLPKTVPKELDGTLTQKGVLRTLERKQRRKRKRKIRRKRKFQRKRGIRRKRRKRRRSKKRRRPRRKRTKPLRKYRLRTAPQLPSTRLQSKPTKKL